MNWSIIWVSFLLMLITSCDDGSEELRPLVDENKNTGPLNFPVTVLRVSSNDATISWGPVYDGDNDPLFHTVLLEDSIISKDLPKDNLVNIENLTPETEYTGVVTVTDRISDTISVPFSFKTKKRFIQFSRTGIGGDVCTKTPDNGYITVGTADTETDEYVLRLSKVDSLGYVEWVKYHSSGGETSALFKPSITRTTDNYYLITHHAGVFKIDDHGDKVWSNVSENVARDRYMGGMEIDKNYYVVGTVFRNGIYENVILKFNQSGTKISEKFTPHVTGTSSYQMIKTADDKFVIMGTKRINEKSVLTLSKFDTEWNPFWTQTFNNNNYDFPRSLELTEDQGFIIGCDNWNNYNVSSARIIKLNGQGYLEWEKTFNTSYSSVRSIAQTVDRGYVYAGSQGDDPTSAVMVKLDETGELAWKQVYKPDYMDFTWIGWDILPEKDGSYFMLGVKTCTWCYEDQERGSWILKTDDAGEWLR